MSRAMQFNNARISSLSNGHQDWNIHQTNRHMCSSTSSLLHTPWLAIQCLAFITSIYIYTLYCCPLFLQASLPEGSGSLGAGLLQQPPLDLWQWPGTTGSHLYRGRGGFGHFVGVVWNKGLAERCTTFVNLTKHYKTAQLPHYTCVKSPCNDSETRASHSDMDA